MQSILELFDPKEIDSVTIAEVKHYAQLKYDEQANTFYSGYFAGAGGAIALLLWLEDD